jgi:hypothetical protein
MAGAKGETCMAINSWVHRTSLAGAAVLALLAGGCSDDPTATGQGDAAAFLLSRSVSYQSVGGHFQLTAAVVDAQHTRLNQRVEVTSTAANVLRVDSTVYLRELAETRVFVTAVGFDTTGAARLVYRVGTLQDTTTVITLPAGLRATAADRLNSGESTTIQVQGLDVDGQPFGAVPFRVSNAGTAAIVSVTPAGAITAKAPGTTEIEVTGPGGQVKATVTVTVVPGNFQGTANPAAPVGGDALVLTAGTGQAPFDADTKVTVGGFPAYVLSRTATQINTVMPYGTPAGTVELLITGIGPDQIALAAPLTVPRQVNDDIYEPNNVWDGDDPTPMTMPLRLVGSVSGDDIDDFFIVTLSQATTVSMMLEWDTRVNEDLDLIVRDVVNNRWMCDFNTATAGIPERGDCELPAGTYWFWVNNYEAEAGGSPALTNYFLTVAPK